MEHILKKLQDKNLDRWLGGYLRHRYESRKEERAPGLKHLMFAICDHYEPLWSKPGHDVGAARVRTWRRDYPTMAQDFRDADGRAPQHSFFFPGEEYHPTFFDDLEALVRGKYGEIELHLHHHDATEASLREELALYLSTYAERGHFSRDETGRIKYAFIHGNWALANARPDGRQCGVDQELQVLFDTGCYADFTFPAAPDIAQPSIVNQIYWPIGDLSKRRCYERGERASVGTRYRDRILMIEGPLAPALRPGSLAVRVENGAVTANDRPTPSRIRSWVNQNIHVAGRPEWVFVKVYTHGAPEKQAAAYLGEGGRVLHRELAAHYNDGIRWKLHYVTAREMTNIAFAAMDGKHGDPNLYRDYELTRPPILR